MNLLHTWWFKTIQRRPEIYSKLKWPLCKHNIEVKIHSFEFTSVLRFELSPKRVLIGTHTGVCFEYTVRFTECSVYFYLKHEHHNYKHTKKSFETAFHPHPHPLHLAPTPASCSSIKIQQNSKEFRTT